MCAHCINMCALHITIYALCAHSDIMLKIVKNFDFNKIIDIIVLSIINRDGTEK